MHALDHLASPLGLLANALSDVQGAGLATFAVMLMGAGLLGRLALAADGQTLVFSQIPNLTAWGEGIANGTLDIANDFDGSAQRATVPITVYATPLNGGTVQTVGSGLEQFVLHP